MTTFEDLRLEYESEICGAEILGRIRSLIRGLLIRRDPRIYARGAFNADDGLEDVLNDFVIDVLLKEGDAQLVYIMTLAATIEDFDRLMLHHARRYLARTRTRTITDNLIDRSRKALGKSPFQKMPDDGASECFGLKGRKYVETAVSTAEQLRSAVTLARAVPKILSDATERAPKVYDAQGLSAVLRILVDSMSAPIERPQLQSFFDGLLTAWTPTILGLTDDYEHVRTSESTEDRVLVRDVARELVTGMTLEEKIIFISKYAGVPDRDIASRLNLSRQSVDPRKRALFERVKEELHEIAEPLHAAVLREAIVEIALLGLDAPA